MPLNDVIVKIALENMNKFNPDTSLYDAIVEMDAASLTYLCNKKYRMDILNHGFTRENINVLKLIDLIENNLSIKSHVKTAC